MRCKEDDCHRRAYASGWCTTHYRRWRTGQPMNSPIRRYVRRDDNAESSGRPLGTKTIRRRREKPFGAESALLAFVDAGC
jgi:hypothetical protein